MANYVFTNPEKERLAREAISNKGIPKGKRDVDASLVAECNLYNRALSENPKISEDDLFVYIYKGLGGRVEEYATKKEAVERVETLQKLVKKASQF